VEKARGQKTHLSKRYMEAQKNMDKARAVEGTAFMRSVSFAVKSDPHLNVRAKRVMGVRVPDISFEAEHFKKGFHERGYGVIGTSVYVDKTAEAYAELLKEIIIAAEIETTMRNLLVEIDKTKRRVNALEFSVIPKMKRQADFIKLRLDEMEREDTFRLKRFKAKAEKKKMKAA
jgi:V/A-type H+-transporting ATPase subunit D